MIDDDESGHFVGDDGPLLAEEGELCNLADWARMLSSYWGRPVVPAALEVLDTVERAGLHIFVTVPLRNAVRLDPKTAGLTLAALRHGWGQAKRLEDFYLRAKWGGQAAILKREAYSAFGFEDEDKAETLCIGSPPAALPAAESAAPLLAAPASASAVGVPVAGLPEGKELWEERRALEQQKRRNPTGFLADKYGASRSTIQRRIKEYRDQENAPTDLMEAWRGATGEARRARK